jgi:hypothetical protein
MLLALMLLLCCSSILISRSAQAQICPTCPCPLVPKDDAQYTITPIPWNAGDTCVDIEGDGCLEKICYAYRSTSPTNFDYCILQVCVDPDCVSADDSTLLRDGSAWLMHNNPQHFPAPNCPCSGTCDQCHGTTIHWNENFISCWTTCFTAQGGKYFQYCPDHGWCIDAYWVCKDPNTGQLKLCYDRSVQTTWQCNNPPPGVPCETPCSHYGCPDRKL